MCKEEFAEVSQAQAAHGGPEIDGTTEIQEIKVLGDWAFMWTKLSVVVTPPDGAPSIERTGHTLTILQRVNGRWMLARDANMLTLVR